MKIVRRLSRAVNTPIGRHIIVTRETKHGVYARNVGEHSEYFLSDDLTHFIDIPHKPCKVSKKEFESLRYAMVITHPLIGVHTKEWKALVKTKPMLIRFWHPHVGVMYIWPDLIKQRVIEGIPCVYIEVKGRCYESTKRKR